MEAQTQPGTNTNSEQLFVRDYSTKSFIVGGNTRPHKEILKSLGGRFNKYLKVDGETISAWVYSNKEKEKVVEVVTRLNSGEDINVLPTQNSENGEMSDLPTVSTPANVGVYQYVKFKIYKPREGQFVDLKTDGKTMRGRVIKTETHDDIVDTVYIDFNGSTSMGMICASQWRIYGYQIAHSLFFTDK